MGGYRKKVFSGLTFGHLAWTWILHDKQRDPCGTMVVSLSFKAAKKGGCK